MPKVKIREQAPGVRIKNFDEVTLGYTPEEAIEEAKRCLECKKPSCVAGCPVRVDIPKFISFVSSGRFDEAAKIIWQENLLAATCGRVCPQERQCEKLCIIAKKDEPVAIGKLERFVADWAMTHQSAEQGTRYPPEADPPCRVAGTVHGTRHRVAVIGSGPAGLSCAAELAKFGYNVTIFESLHIPGGVLTYGIPEFRLPKRVISWEIGQIKKLGVEIEVDTLVGRTVTIEELKTKGYGAFFIGTGAGLPLFLEIEGENLNGVYSANEFLTRVNLMKGYLFPEYDTPVWVGERVGVVGAGNVAIDAARSARRLGAKEVYIIYRRTEKEMPARIEEIQHAKEEGIKFMLLTSPVKILGDLKGWVAQMICQKNELGPPDESGRRSPVAIPGSGFTINMDTIICAIGNGPNPLLPSFMLELTMDKRGNIVVDENLQTSIKSIFAGGDIVTGAATVISAMGQGKRAARSIHAWLIG